jgi:hypothetical protein
MIFKSVPLAWVVCVSCCSAWCDAPPGFYCSESVPSLSKCTDTPEFGEEEYCSSWCNHPLGGKWSCGAHTDGQNGVTCNCNGCAGCHGGKLYPVNKNKPRLRYTCFPPCAPGSYQPISGQASCESCTGGGGFCASGFDFENKVGRGTCSPEDTIEDVILRSEMAVQARCIALPGCNSYTWSNDPYDSQHQAWLCSKLNFDETNNGKKWRKWRVGRAVYLGAAAHFTPCPRGFFANGTIGKTVAGGHTACTSCPAGKYQSQEGKVGKVRAHIPHTHHTHHTQHAQHAQQQKQAKQTN